ncbi:uncharacterized protein LOC119081351 isoform X3 [Bradysia coprophila]|nr:uncharacterized protein LOC119081351 isoform X3 [Bradysia coprophila]
MDNHTVLEHQELFKTSRLPLDVVDRVHEIPEFVPQQYQHPPNIQLCDKKDSIGSIDSDVSMTYDVHHESSNPSGESSDENAKDSGCDVNAGKMEEVNVDEPIEVPDDDLAEKIVTQVEFYFSNENILKDAFLLKHVRRNKEGFVSLKLVSSFKRVRQLCKDWRVVGYAIKLKSVNIEVNDLGTKIRRLDPLPVFDETMPSRTVVATDLPLDKLTIEKISELFSKCGEIALIRILRPGGSIPADVRHFMNKYPEMRERECALVEFTESQAARNAQNLEGMQIYEMVAPKMKTGKKASITKMVENYKYPSHADHERSRGGGGDDYKFNMIRRNSSGFFPKHETNHVCYQQQPVQFQRKFSFNNGENYEHFNRRPSNCSMASSADNSRKYSNCSESYSGCSEASRRQSMCSDASRRQSNCSDVPFRRTSNCSEFCPCSRKVSQCSDSFRRLSQCSDHGRRFSNGSVNYERRMSNTSENGRRVSFDSEYDRKISTGSFEHYRKISGGFDASRKLSNGSDQWYNGRKISNDSGYDRRSSVNSMMSDYGSSPRSRSTSMAGIVKGENLVRTPIGPDGSKGFASRARKVGHAVVGPV